MGSPATQGMILSFQQLESHLTKNLTFTETLEEQILQDLGYNHVLKAQNFIPESASAHCKYITWVDPVFKFSIIAKMSLSFFFLFVFKTNPLHNTVGLIYSEYCSKLLSWSSPVPLIQCELQSTFLSRNKTISQPKSQERDRFICFHKNTWLALRRFLLYLEGKLA